MFVSVIIPCYNYAKFLPEAVESVLGQSYHNWECIIVDDGSPDNTREVAEKLAARDERIRYHYKPNGGLSSARNFGIEKASGDLVCFLDADDKLHKDKLKYQVQCFLDFPASHIIYGKAMFFESGEPGVYFLNKEKTNNTHFYYTIATGRKLLPHLVRNNITVISSPLLKKSVFDLAGNFDESYRSYEDWHFWLRCAMKDLHFRYCDKPEVCTYIRFGHESMMSDRRKLLRAAIQLRKYLFNELSFDLKVYNLYRLIRSKLKLMLS